MFSRRNSKTGFRLRFTINLPHLVRWWHWKKIKRQIDFLLIAIIVVSNKITLVTYRKKGWKWGLFAERNCRKFSTSICFSTSVFYYVISQFRFILTGLEEHWYGERVKVGWTGQHVYWFPVASCVVPQYKKGPEFERFITNRLLTVQLLRHTSSSEAFLEISFVYNEICSGKVLNLFGFLFLRNYVYVFILLISERFLPSLWHALWPRRQPQAQANLPLPIPHPQAAMTQMESWNDPLLPLW